MIRLLAFLSMALVPLALQAEPRPLVTQIIQPEAVLPGTFVGTIEADTTVGVAFELLGRLTSRAVSEGDRVTKGQVLAQLDATARAEDRDAARAAVESAEISLGTIARARDRMKSLLARGVASEVALETVERNHSVAEAQLEQARATLARAEHGLSRMTLIAPMDGIVIQTRFEPGTTVAAGDPVLVLASPKGRTAVVTLPSTLLREVDETLKFRVHASKLPPSGIEGNLLRIDPASVSQTRMRTTRISLGAEAEVLAIGELVEVQIAADPESHLLVPQSALMTEGDKTFVWTVQGDPRIVTRRPVTLGQIEGGKIRIQGIEAGSEVVLRGIHSLTDGQKVGPSRPLPPNTSPLRLGE